MNFVLNFPLFPTWYILYTTSSHQQTPHPTFSVDNPVLEQSSVQGELKNKKYIGIPYVFFDGNWLYGAKNV